MKIEITEYEKRYSFELKPITQICGHNIQRKTYVLESLRKYFSNYKYPERKNKWRDNTFIDGANVGRRYFSVHSIQNTLDLLSTIKISKQSLMMEYLKNLFQGFSEQKHIDRIEEELDIMFLDINKEMNSLGDINLFYSMGEIWDIIPKSTITGTDELPLDDKTPYELLQIFVNILEQVLSYTPRKTLVIIEDIDHLVTRTEYHDFLKFIQTICDRFDVSFLFTISMDGYCVITDTLIEGVTVMGKETFIFPELDIVLREICEQYPYYKLYNKEEMCLLLQRIVQRIGDDSYIVEIDENVCTKLINKSMLLDDCMKKPPVYSEITYLMQK